MHIAVASTFQMSAFTVLMTYFLGNAPHNVCHQLSSALREYSTVSFTIPSTFFLENAP